MKKIVFLTIVAALVIAPATLAIERFPAQVEPAGTTVIVPDVAIEKAPPLEVITIVHFKKDFAKPAEPGRGNNARVPACYGFISAYAKLIATENLLVNPTNSGMTETEVLSGIQSSAATWDNQTSASLFGNVTASSTANFDTYADGQNEISFGNYSQSGVIAVTRIWGYFSGKPNSRYITQFDLMFDTDFAWGDAEVNAALMDLKNIATHELGHGVGLNDMYTSSCQEVTMYGYSNFGEITKRTLAAPDIQGLRILYGI